MDAVHNAYLANSKEDGAEDRDEPVLSAFDGPCEPEQRQWNKNGANIRKGETELRFGFTVVAARKGVEDCINSRNDEPNGEEETDTWAEIRKANLRGIEAIDTGVNILEVCI